MRSITLQILINKINTKVSACSKNMKTYMYMGCMKSFENKSAVENSFGRSTRGLRWKGVSLWQEKLACKASPTRSEYKSLADAWCLSKPKSWNEANARHLSSGVLSLPWTEPSHYIVSKLRAWLRLMTPASDPSRTTWKLCPLTWADLSYQMRVNELFPVVIYTLHLKFKHQLTKSCLLD